MQQSPPGQPGPQGMPGRPTPEQIAAMQRQIAADAQKAGMTVPEFIQHLQRQAREQMMAQQQAQQQGGGGAPGGPGGPGGQHQHPHPHPPQQGVSQGTAQPITPGPPNPVALAMAKFLRGQDLKLRTVILNGERKDMFRVKRALRALQSPAYEKLRTKTPGLPEITDRASLENAFKMLPMSMLALRVVKVEEPASADGSSAKKAKRVKGQWTVTIERQQDAADDMYYIWFYEGPQIMRKVYAGLALLAIFAVVLYPLWPRTLRQGVYYLSWGFLGLLGLFFLMAIFRVILFCITYFVLSPGLWLYPNLWEDVSFMDSFRPVWAWHDPNPKKKKKSKAAASSATSSSAAQSHFAAVTGQPQPASATTTATSMQATAVPTQRPKGYQSPRVEEVEDE